MYWTDSRLCVAVLEQDCQAKIENYLTSKELDIYHISLVADSSLLSKI
jgi:hypothetical protein